MLGVKRFGQSTRPRMTPRMLELMNLCGGRQANIDYTHIADPLSERTTSLIAPH